MTLALVVAVMGALLGRFTVGVSRETLCWDCQCPSFS